MLYEVCCLSNNKDLCFATKIGILVAKYLHIRINNFVAWPHSGAVMHYIGYVEPRDGAVSLIRLSRQEAVACVPSIQEDCWGNLSVSGGNQKRRSLKNGKTSSSNKN
jgi:hypothetical protein